MRAYRKLVYLAFTFWTVVITVRYSRAVLQSVGSPFNEGADVEWLVVWLAIAVFTCLAITLRRFLHLALGLLIAACLTITILSGAFMSAVMALWIFVLTWAWGLRILQVASVQIEDAPQGRDGGARLVGVPALACDFLGALVEVQRTDFRLAGQRLAFGRRPDMDVQFTKIARERFVRLVIDGLVTEKDDEIFRECPMQLIDLPVVDVKAAEFV